MQKQSNIYAMKTYEHAPLSLVFMNCYISSINGFGQ